MRRLIYRLLGVCFHHWKYGAVKNLTATVPGSPGEWEVTRQERTCRICGKKEFAKMLEL